MSNFQFTNTTNTRTNTLSTALDAGSTTIPIYTQADATITSSALVNAAIEATTTGYLFNGKDIGNTYSAIYNDHTVTGPGVIPVANYSKCALVMCCAGGCGSQIQPTLTGGDGGNGGIRIRTNIPLSGVSNINYAIGTGGARGVGFQALPVRAATAECTGNATTVIISGTTYSANRGGAGPTSNPAGPNGTITPAIPEVYTTATLNRGLLFVTTPDRIITISAINYCQGGLGGNINASSNGNNGTVGNCGYLRVYLYP
jgi:hypothetical protein